VVCNAGLFGATRPVILGTHGVTASGNYLATVAGIRIMEQGGNAVDAGVAMVLAQNVLEPESCGFGGEVPILVYSAKDGKVHAISGQGVAPRAATIDWFKHNGFEKIPGDGFLPAVVPAVMDALALAL